MAFIRAKRKREFTIIDNKALQDAELSLGAIGLLAKMLSFPEDWKFYETDLVSRSHKDGRDKVHKFVIELQKARYITKPKQERDEKGHYRSTADWIVSDFRQGESPITENPSTGNPCTGNPHTGKPTTVNPQLQNTNTTKDLYNKRRIKKTRASGDDASVSQLELIKFEFEKLWKKYPNKKGKKQAFNHYKAWRKQSRSHTFEYIDQRLDEYLNHIQVNNVQPRYIMYGSTWFNGRFEDELDIQNNLPQSNGAGFDQLPGGGFTPGDGSSSSIDDDDLPF